jgi:HSP20 family protein
MTTLMRYRNPLNRLWPLADLDEVRRQARRLFDEADAPLASGHGFAFTPALDITEDDNEMILTAELPGMKPEDVTVEVDNNILVLKGEKKAEFEKKDARYHVWERSYGGFERMIPLPRMVNADGIEAQFDNGLLRVKLPKVAEAKGRKIEVTAK